MRHVYSSLFRRYKLNTRRSLIYVARINNELVIGDIFVHKSYAVHSNTLSYECGKVIFFDILLLYRKKKTNKHTHKKKNKPKNKKTNKHKQTKKQTNKQTNFGKNVRNPLLHSHDDIIMFNFAFL